MSSEEERVAWLRRQVEVRLRVASVKIIRCRWYADGEPWEYGTGIKDERGGSVAVAIGGYAADHITANDPEIVIVQCEAELAVLDELAAAKARKSAEAADYGAWVRGEASAGRPDFNGPDPDLIPGLERAVRLLAAGYCHRDGYADHWGDQG